jgi:hypothetical protein
MHKLFLVTLFFTSESLSATTARACAIVWYVWTEVVSSPKGTHKVQKTRTSATGHFKIPGSISFIAPEAHAFWFGQPAQADTFPAFLFEKKMKQWKDDHKYRKELNEWKIGLCWEFLFHCL